MAANLPLQAPPWVRLALRTCPANGPAPTPAPESSPPHPRPLLARPTFRQIGQPQRPLTQSQEPVPPPSPLTLPPSRIKSDADLKPKIPLEAEPKTVDVQKTIGKSNDWPWTKGTDSDRNFPEARKPTAGHIPRNEPFKEMEKKGVKVHGKKISSDSEEIGRNVIKIAGENKGASIEIFHSPKKNAFEGNSYHCNRKENSGSRSRSDEEKNLKSNDNSHKGMPMNAPPMSALMNSNVQGVNNSLVFQSSYTHHDPGVHLSLSQKPAASGFNVKDRGNGHQS